MESDGRTSEESQKWLETNTGNLAVMTFWPQISACLFNLLSVQTSFLSPGPMVRTAALFYSRVWQSLGTTGLCCAVACERSGSREPRKRGSNASHWLGRSEGGGRPSSRSRICAHPWDCQRLVEREGDSWDLAGGS